MAGDHATGKRNQTMCRTVKGSDSNFTRGSHSGNRSPMLHQEVRNMCIEDNCNDDLPKNGIERRSFLAGATAAVIGVALSPEISAQQPPPSNALSDPNVIQGVVSFKSGADNIEG